VWLELRTVRPQWVPASPPAGLKPRADIKEKT